MSMDESWFPFNINHHYRHLLRIGIPGHWQFPFASSALHLQLFGCLVWMDLALDPMDQMVWVYVHPIYPICFLIYSISIHASIHESICLSVYLMYLCAYLPIFLFTFYRRSRQVRLLQAQLSSLAVSQGCSNKCVSWYVQSKTNAAISGVMFKDTSWHVHSRKTKLQQWSYVRYSISCFQEATEELLPEEPPKLRGHTY